MSTAVATRAAILFDLVPATVEINGKYHVDKARVVIVGDEVHLIENVDGQAVVTRFEKIDTFTRARLRGDPTVILTAYGSTWEVHKGSGCGCGSPIQRFNPRMLQ